LHSIVNEEIKLRDRKKTMRMENCNGRVTWERDRYRLKMELDLQSLFRLHVHGTVTFFIQALFIRDKVYTNFLYTGPILYGTKFIQDKVYTGTKFIRGQSLYGDKVYMGQSLYGDKVYMRTKFIQTFFILYLK
jgi:hypothetical protein